MITQQQLDEWKLRLCFNGATLPNADALDLIASLEEAREALKPFQKFFKSEKHDLSPANDATIVAAFLDQENHLPLGELYISDFRRAAKAGDVM